jgi:hypothetical protein
LEARRPRAALSWCRLRIRPRYRCPCGSNNL